MRYILALTFLLAALWLAISGVYKPVILLLGVGSIGLVVWLAMRMEVVGEEHNPVIYSWRLPLYWGWLLWQIVLANLHVARLILSPRRIQPQVFKVPVSYRSAVAGVTYANSTTLTPGTVSLLLTPSELTVHALDARSAEDLKQGRMARKIAWLEGSDPEHP
jgi:multicomponent Na+:H+ antiporter subunit E